MPVVAFRNSVIAFRQRQTSPSTPGLGRAQIRKSSLCRAREYSQRTVVCCTTRLCGHTLGASLTPSSNCDQCCQLVGILKLLITSKICDNISYFSSPVSWRQLLVAIIYMPNFTGYQSLSIANRQVFYGRFLFRGSFFLVSRKETIYHGLFLIVT